MAQQWPKGNSAKHADAARKGWETRRRNAAAAGIAIGDTVGHAKRKPPAQLSPVSAHGESAAKRARGGKPEPQTTAERRRAAYAPKLADYWLRVVTSHEYEPDAFRAVGGGISATDRKKAKAKARWYWMFLETRDPRTGMHGGREIHVDY